MDVTEVAHEPETELARWTANDFLKLLGSRVFRNRDQVELVDGLIIVEQSQGNAHAAIFNSLQLAFEAMGATNRGLMVLPTVVLGANGVVEPELALVRLQWRGRPGLPRGADVLWVVEVSVTSRRKDLTQKKDAYAVAGIPHYWVFDGARRGVWTFAEPVDGDYTRETFVPAGEQIELPVLGGWLDTHAVFPPAEQTPGTEGV